MTNFETKRLRTICGEHCVDLQALNALLAALPKESEVGILRVSFQDVGALSSAFASSLLTTLDDWKKACPGRRVVLCDLSVRHQKVIDLCRSALQAASASTRQETGGVSHPNE